MDLLSIVVNNQEPMEIILLTYFEIESCVSKQLGTCHWRSFENKVDKYAVTVVDNENNVLVIYQKGKVENMRKQYFTF